MCYPVSKDFKNDGYASCLVQSSFVIFNKDYCISFLLSIVPSMVIYSFEFP